MCDTEVYTENYWPISMSDWVKWPIRYRDPPCLSSVLMVQIASDSSQGFCDRDLNHILLDRLDQINIYQHIGKDNIIIEGAYSAWWTLTHGECPHEYEFLCFRTITLNTWHKVRIIRNGLEASLQLDSEPFVSGRSPAPMTSLNLGEPLYLGGFRWGQSCPSDA